MRKKAEWLLVKPETMKTRKWDARFGRFTLYKSGSNSYKIL